MVPYYRKTNIQTLIEQMQWVKVTKRKETVSLKCIKLLVFIMEWQCVYCKVDCPVSLMHCYSPVVLCISEICVSPRVPACQKDILPSFQLSC